MKVLMINGSPHQKGCTYTALKEVEKSLLEENIETCWLHIGTQAIHDCIDCGYCATHGMCIFKDDCLNKALELIQTCDGLIIGSPVYYASATGAITSFLDRLFYAGSHHLRFKPASAIVSARRAGTTASLDQLQKYFLINQMPIVSSRYWNMVHGNTPEEVLQDIEGLQTMRALGKNMAWLLKCIQAGKDHQIHYPSLEDKAFTNFIRS